MAKGKKFYVVWSGHKPGIYTTWAECEAQVKGFKEGSSI
ncbi:RNase H1/viroplasmin domain-containing protein [Priestia filamentosa]